MNTCRAVRLTLPIAFAFAGLLGGCGGGTDAQESQAPASPPAAPPSGKAGQPRKKKLPASTIAQQKLRIEELRTRINALPEGTDDELIRKTEIQQKLTVIEIEFSKTYIKAMALSTQGIQNRAHYDLNQIEKRLLELEDTKK